MFDVGFSECLVIAVVALIVLGPERLPKAARFVGLLIRRVREHWFSVRHAVERELDAEQLRQELQNTHAALQEMKARLDLSNPPSSAVHAQSKDMIETQLSSPKALAQSQQPALAPRLPAGQPSGSSSASQEHRKEKSPTK